MPQSTIEYRLLSIPGRDGDLTGLGDKVYASEHGARTGRAMRYHGGAPRDQIKIVKVRVEIIEEIE